MTRKPPCSSVSMELFTSESSPEFVDGKCEVHTEKTATMPLPTHRTHDNDFREETVNLLLSSGHPLKRVVAEPGITTSSL